MGLSICSRPCEQNDRSPARSAGRVDHLQILYRFDRTSFNR
jgi:hypothetical protein